MADLVVDGLVVEYSPGGQPVRPIDGLDVRAPGGTLALLLGPSGSGKTTLLSCLAGILSPTEGDITFGDVHVSALGPKERTEYRRHTVGIVFQAFNLVPSLTAAENVMAPMLAAGVKKPEAARRAAELLEQVGLEARVAHRPGELSGGQQQRVAIARALVHDPPLLLADEPTAHLDHTQVDGVLAILGELINPDRVIVIATHDDRVLALGTQVVDLGPPGTSRAPAPEAAAPGDGGRAGRPPDPTPPIAPTPPTPPSIPAEPPPPKEKAMAKISAKSFDSPDETRTPEKTKLDMVDLGGAKAARLTAQPGWRWSECIQPVVGGDSCQTRHFGVVVAGRMHITHEDGTDLEIAAGDAYLIEPGHDAWVVGDEEFVGYEFDSASAGTYAAPPS